MVPTGAEVMGGISGLGLGWRDRGGEGTESVAAEGVGWEV